MANSAGICSSFKREVLCGIHALGTSVVRAGTGADVIKAALFGTGASVGPGTATYSITGEVTGAGYAAGGVPVTNGNQPAATGTTAFWTPSASIVFTGVTVGPADCLLLYNSSQGNKAIASYTFAAQTLVAGTLTLTMPTNDAASALLQIG